MFRAYGFQGQGWIEEQGVSKVAKSFELLRQPPGRNRSCRIYVRVQIPGVGSGFTL